MSELAIAELTLHSACEQVPRMNDDDWTRFVADVKQRGVQEPIVVHRGGIVLDGRHRLQAAQARGDQTIPCRVVDLSAHAQLEYIFTSAVMRRHLTDDQRSVLAARFREQLSKIARTERARKGGKGGGVGRAKPASFSGTTSKQLPKQDTRREAAQQFRVPERKLRSAMEIQRTSPELAGRVLTGDLTLPQAKQELRREQKRAELKAKAEQAQEATTTTSSWEIHHGDCVAILPTLTDQARLIFADPPYNIGVDYGDGHAADKLSDEQYLAWVETWLAGCRDRLTPDGSLWVLIGDEYAAEYGVLLKRLGLTIRSWIKWFESFGVNCSRNFNRCSRHLFYCVRDPQRFVFHEDSVTRPSDRQTKYGDKRAAPSGKLWDNVWGIEPAIPRLAAGRLNPIPVRPGQRECWGMHWQRLRLPHALLDLLPDRPAWKVSCR